MFLSIFSGRTLIWTLMCPCLSTFIKKKKKNNVSMVYLLALHTFSGLSKLIYTHYISRSGILWHGQLLEKKLELTLKPKKYQIKLLLIIRNQSMSRFVF